MIKAVGEIITRIIWLGAYVTLIGAALYWLFHDQWMLTMVAMLTTEVMDINLRHKIQCSARQRNGTAK